MKLDWWSQLISLKGLDPLANKADEDAPNGGVGLWIFASRFLLREVELAALTLYSNCIKFNESDRVISLHLTVQKNDPLARGSWRSLSCSCEDSPLCCPFHVGRRLFDDQVERLHLVDMDDARLIQFPLVGRRSEPSWFVEKQAVIAEVQRHVEIIINEVCPGLDLLKKRVTGHTFRRSGAKELARKGVPFAEIQWLARHSSSATWAYVEEAWEEAPRQSMRLNDVASLCQVLNKACSRVDQLECQQRVAISPNSLVSACSNNNSSWLADRVASLTERISAVEKKPSCSAEVSFSSQQAFVAEVRKVMTPVHVCNLHSLH